MPKVLIPSDELNFILGLVEGYRSLGWQVATGTNNFKIRAANYDVVHHQWPEELTKWQVPGERDLDQVRQDLEWWASHSTIIFSVNNLYPHNGIGNPAYHALYSYFYQHCHLITHYSNASHRMVLEEFPAARTARHIVHSPANYEAILDIQQERGSRRAELGIREDEFVILMLGRLRTWGEVKLIQRAYGLAKIPKKRLLMAGRLMMKVSPVRRRAMLLRWRLWLRRHHAVVSSRFVPKDLVFQFVDSCDVSIVPRLGGISSGIPGLAMTFGRTVIAPNHGAYPEYFAGTRNLLYETGSAESFASKLEEAAALDTDAIGRENAIVASRWSWREICRACLEAVPERNLSGR